jgi:hypothetical protein
LEAFGGEAKRGEEKTDSSSKMLDGEPNFVIDGMTSLEVEPLSEARLTEGWSEV